MENVCAECGMPDLPNVQGPNYPFSFVDGIPYCRVHLALGYGRIYSAKVTKIESDVSLLEGKVENLEKV